MNVENALIKGLQSAPKYVPVWYRYDKQGSEYNDRCLDENKYYYFYSSEVNVLKQHVKDMVQQVSSPCILVEMGSGNSEKSRIFIDAILEQQPKLQYVPVDISKDFLQETCEAVARDYGEKLDVRPIAGDYSVGIDGIRNISGNKLIIWLGGGFQNQPYKVQADRIESLSKTMTENDRLIIALDVTQNAQEVENAYLDPTGISAFLYLNAIWRMNREYGSNIDTDKLELEAKFVHRPDSNTTSCVLLRARAKEDQSYDIPGLGISLTLAKDEYINMFEGEGVSCKYTVEQIRTLVKTGKQNLDRVWTDPEKHVSLCCIRK